MSRICFTYRKVSVSFPIQEMERLMGVLLPAGANLADKAQQGAIFDIVSRHHSAEEIYELVEMTAEEFVKLITVVAVEPGDD